MRAFASLTLLALAAGCAGVKSSPGAPVEPHWSCTGGTVSCWNATRQASGAGFNGETVCEWSCADYEGTRAALTMRLWPICGDPLPTDRECPWICYVQPVEPRRACSAR
jgi:hypothetical protein